MRRYFIQHTASTLAEFLFVINWIYKENPEIIIDWYKITQSNQDVFDSIKEEKFWIVEKEIFAENWIQARNIFIREFFPIANKLWVISQCYLNFLWESYIVQKLSHNPKRIFYCYDVNYVEPVWLVFWKNELDSFGILSNHTKTNSTLDLAFIYLQASNNTVWWYARIMLLFATLETLAWKLEKVDKDWEEYTTYNKSEMSRILWNKYFNDLFWKGWLRHKINHWDDISRFFSKMSGEQIDYLAEVYKKIIDYINTIYDVKINTSIVLPQRHPFGNKEISWGFYKPYNTDIQINLLNCSNLDNKNDFEPIFFNPKNY